MNKPAAILVGDVGGTHARFALADPVSLACRKQATLACANFENLADAIEAYLGTLSVPRPVHACLAVAAPITGRDVSFTNLTWQFHIDTLQATLGLESLAVINDFAALACALPHLSANETQTLGPDSKSLDVRQPMAVLGPGTGLGVAALIPDLRSERHIPLASQGGHIHFAPNNEFEQALLIEMRQHMERVSMEDILSGRGLCALYTSMMALGHITGPVVKTSAEITAALQAGEMGARRCIDRFCAILGSLAGDLALVYGARGGVFIGGGLVNHFPDRLVHGSFRERFEDKGAMRPYLTAIATRVITAKTPALTGAAAYWQQHHPA